MGIGLLLLYRSRLYRYRTGRPPVDLSTFAQLLAYAGSAVGVAMVAPQIVRTVKHPHLGGVSPWSWAKREDHHRNIMHRAGATAGEHPHEENHTAECEGHEQIVTVFLDDSIEKPRHFEHVMGWILHKLVFCSLLLLPTA